MYNEEIKNEYIKQRDSEVKLWDGYLFNLFRKTCEYEMLLNKDVSLWDIEEIESFYMQVNTPSMEVLICINSQLKLYSTWCMNQELFVDGKNFYYDINNDNIGKCINRSLLDKWVFSKDDIIKMINDLPNASDQFILYALFEGISGKDYCEIINAKTSDFKDGMFYACTGRVFQVPNLLKYIALESANTWIYYTIDGPTHRTRTVSGAKDVIVKYKGENAINVNDYQKGRRVYNAINRCIKYLGYSGNITGNVIRESGRINFIREQCEKYKISPEEYLLNKVLRQDMEDKYGHVPSIARYMMKYGKYVQ